MDLPEEATGSICPGLKSEFPSPRWICLKRLSELHLAKRALPNLCSNCVAKVVLFSVVSVCGFVCLFVNSITLEPFEISS